MTLGVQICWSRFRENPPAPEADVETVAKAAFRTSPDNSNTWFATRDEEWFKIGIGLLLLHYQDNHEVHEQILHTLKGLQTLSAAMGGVPVNWAALGEIKAMPLMVWYKEVKAESNGS